MNLKDLGLNRLISKDSAIIADSSLAYTSDSDSSLKKSQDDNSASISSLTTAVNDMKSDYVSSEKEKLPAGNVLTGTVITSCLFKTSDSGDRVEISSFIDTSNFPSSFIFPVGFKDADCIIVYDGTGQDFNVLINRYGIFTTWINANDLLVNNHLTVKDLSVTEDAIINRNFRVDNLFTYGGKIQPVNYHGYIKYNVAATTLPIGWSVTHLGTGQYRITHNLGTTNYTVTATDKSEVGGPATLILYTIDNFSSNSFDVLSFDYTGAGATDASFFFQVMRTI